MFNQRRLAEALIGPPFDPERRAARVANPPEVLVRANHIDRRELVAQPRQSQRPSTLLWLIGVAEAALDAKVHNVNTSRIWWR